jgi:hypothetical protein
MYLKPDKARDKSKWDWHKQHYKCKVDDLVRISHLKRPFLRAYDQQWSSEIFKIYQRFLIEGWCCVITISNFLKFVKISIWSLFVKHSIHNSL